MADLEHVLTMLWWDAVKLKFGARYEMSEHIREAMQLLRSQSAEISSLKARLAECYLFIDGKLPNLTTCPGWREGER